MTRHPQIVGVLSWNLFHGRSAPPDPRLRTWRSRLLRVTEVGATHAHVNRSLRREFVQVLERPPWDVAMLQEAPPRWLEPLCRALRCHGALALTARNFPALPRALVAEVVPDLIAANEGGSNQILVRPPWRIVETRRHTLVRSPERRRMLWARLVHPDGAELTAANVHGTTVRGPDAERQMLAATERAVEWSAGLPLVFGGDLNLRPRRSPSAFAELRDRLGLHGAGGPDAIDHVLVRGAEAVEPARALAPEQREVPGPRGRALRLSDHAPVQARIRVSAARTAPPAPGSEPRAPGSASRGVIESRPSPREGELGGEHG